MLLKMLIIYTFGLMASPSVIVLYIFLFIKRRSSKYSANAGYIICLLTNLMGLFGGMAIFHIKPYPHEMACAVAIICSFIESSLISIAYGFVTKK